MKQNTMVIYKITCNGNNNCYIGQTKQKPKRRWWQHKTLLRKEKHSNPYIQYSWDKYGEGSFKFEILERCSCLDELNQKELDYIDKFNSHISRDGFNIRKGGNNSPCPDTVKKEFSKKVIAYNLDGSFKEIYPSIIEATRQTEADRKGISNCLKKKQQTSGGLQWRRYTENYPKEINSNKGWRKNAGKTKKIPVKIWNDKEEKEFCSFKEAAKYVGCCPSQLRSVTYNYTKSKTAYGYKVKRIGQKNP